MDWIRAHMYRCGATYARCARVVSAGPVCHARGGCHAAACDARTCMVSAPLCHVPRPMGHRAVCIVELFFPHPPHGTWPWLTTVGPQVLGQPTVGALYVIPNSRAVHARYTGTIHPDITKQYVACHSQQRMGDAPTPRHGRCDSGAQPSPELYGCGRRRVARTHKVSLVRTDDPAMWTTTQTAGNDVMAMYD